MSDRLAYRPVPDKFRFCVGFPDDLKTDWRAENTKHIYINHSYKVELFDETKSIDRQFEDWSSMARIEDVAMGFNMELLVEEKIDLESIKVPTLGLIIKINRTIKKIFDLVKREKLEI